MKFAVTSATVLLLAGIGITTPQPTIAQQSTVTATTHSNPWNPSMTGIAPIKVLDPKAVAMLSVAEDKKPVFEITIEDIGLYFGYLIPAHVAGFETTRRALELLYPDGLPERGQIRIAGPEKNDIMLVASYLTGARDFYLVEDEAGGDVVIDPTLGADQPGKYVIIFQREDNGRTVEAVFDRPALVPDNKGAGDYGNTAPVYINLLNGRTPAGDPREHKRIINGLMDLILKFDPEKLYSAKVIGGYDFPNTGRLDPMPQSLKGVTARWFAAAEALDASAYAKLFASNGRLTIGNGKAVTGRQSIESTVAAFFKEIKALDHRVEAVWTSGTQTIVEGQALYTLPKGNTVSIPMSVIVRTNGDQSEIRDARVYIDATPLVKAADRT